MADAFSKRQRASEDCFFKREQERAVFDYLGKILEEGRSLDLIPQPNRKNTDRSSVLPQIMAQELRLGNLRPQPLRVNNIKMDFKTVPRVNFVPYFNSPYFDPALPSESLSVGRGKWASGNASVEGTSIFNLRKGLELANGSELPKHVNVRPIKMAQPETVKILGRNLRLMPDYTPGRALLWGSILAMWGTGAILLRTSRSLDINSISDVKDKMNNLIAPKVARIPEILKPIKVLEQYKQTGSWELAEEIKKQMHKN